MGFSMYRLLLLLLLMLLLGFLLQLFGVSGSCFGSGLTLTSQQLLASCLGKVRGNISRLQVRQCLTSMPSHNVKDKA